MVEFDRPGERSPEQDCCSLTVTDVPTTCAVVIFRVKVSCITSVVFSFVLEKIYLWLVKIAFWSNSVDCFDAS